MTDADRVRAELTERIAHQERSIDVWRSSADRSPTALRTASARAGFAWFDIAVCRLLLADAGRARTAFAEAAEWMFESLAHVPPPTLATYESALESAVLSGDHELATRFAAAAVEPEPRPSLVHDRLHWALALPALVAGDDERAGHHGDRASAVPEGKASYPGLGDAVRAVVSRNSPAVADALARVLAKHVRYARNRTSHCFNWGPCLVCIPATVLAAIAARRGVAVGEVDGRRATIPFKLLFSTQPAETVRIEADFLPESLIAA